MPSHLGRIFSDFHIIGAAGKAAAVLSYNAREQALSDA
jgi:hypothetical protein